MDARVKVLYMRKLFNERALRTKIHARQSTQVDFIRFALKF